MSLQSHMSSLVGAAFGELGLDDSFGQVLPSQRRELAQFQCNGAMAAAKAVGRAPREIATDVVELLSSEPEIASLEVAGPGFINIDLTDEAIAAWSNITANDELLGFKPTDEVLTVVVDYAGPNVAKAMHVGHLRGDDHR